ncbi:Anaphase-promoting complex subunit 8 [Vanrija albida]|uniref:Anaphase-promoting complex subunit 8 n=1 Tax=Vanrija albida TaxID=181172 RepID=A0ABR3Q837_9TREE
MSPPPLSAATKIQMAHDIRVTIRELKDRGLLVAAKWASELLTSLPKEYRTSPYLPFSPPTQQFGLSSPPRAGPRPSLGEFLPSPGPGMFSGSGLNAEPGPSRSTTRHGIELEEEDDVLEEDEFQLAKSYFDIRELDRVVHTLRNAKGSRARFLKCYAAYLSADRKAQESLPHFLDTKQERLALFPALNSILDEIDGDTDPYLTYLRGLLHMRLEQRQAATECFVKSIRERPYNWSCWSQLAQLVDSADRFIELKESLPSTPMLTFFAIAVMLDLHTATDLVQSMIAELQAIFPTSVHLRAQRAMVYYHQRDFQAAEKEFDMVQQADPYRMEEVDIYSNMLYVMDKRAKLGKLAHEYAEIDRNRPEVCCLIGNYYSSRADHTKAITYFKRALMFNRDYLPAWTLMGHEFVELKNSHAAIEAYRKAIDVNAKDYRAWYGLGQAYELLDMPMYAIEYYNQATSLRPYDCRMWSALATVYEGLGRLSDAIAAHTRALLGADKTQTPQILTKLASLHATLDASRGVMHSRDAAEYHRKLLALGESERTEFADLAPSYMIVAEYEMRGGLAERSARKGRRSSVVASRRKSEPPLPEERGDWALAARYLEKLAQSNAPQRDRASELLRELRVKEARLGLGA